MNPMSVRIIVFFVSKIAIVLNMIEIEKLFIVVVSNTVFTRLFTIGF